MKKSHLFQNESEINEESSEESSEEEENVTTNKGNNKKKAGRVGRGRGPRHPSTNVIKIFQYSKEWIFHTYILILG